MKNSKFIIGFIIVFVILAVACSQSQNAIPQSNNQPAASSGNKVAVTITGFKFVPADASVKNGDTVVWTNQDSVPHTVESSDKAFKSDELSKGDTFSFTFTKAGIHKYNCGIHPSMHGSVTVQ